MVDVKLSIFLGKDYSLGFTNEVSSALIDAIAFSCNRYQNMVPVLQGRSLF